MNAGRRPGGGVFVAVDVHYRWRGQGSGGRGRGCDLRRPAGRPDRARAGGPALPARQFYLRELPPPHVALDGLQHMRLLVVDGYADLDPAGRAGLGAHAHAEFGVPVIGVAKTAFRTATQAMPVLRGEDSPCPLYVTAAGMPRHDAADMVRHMAGRHRLPDALHRADALARGRPPRP